jgi:hypothetical protein
VRADPNKIEGVRRRLTSMFSAASVDVIDPHDGGWVEFFVRRFGRPPRRVRISWERFEDHDTAEEILPDSARAHIDAGSVRITNAGIEEDPH